MSLNVNRGARTTNTDTTLQIRDVDSKVYLREAEVAPLVAFLEKAKPETTSNYKFEWINKSIGTPFAYATTGYSDSATDIVVGAGEAKQFTVGDIVWNPATGEHMRVTVVTVGTETLTVVRGFGHAAAIVVSGQLLVLLGSAHAEGGLSPDAKTLISSLDYNYTQIFKTSINLTRTENQTARYDPKDPKMVQLRKEAMILHMEERERAYLFGERKLDVGGATPIHTTRGFKSCISTNVIDFSGSFTKLKFDQAIEQVNRYGGRNKVLMSSSSLLNAIHSEVFNKSNMLITEKTKEWGLSISRYKSPYGDIDIVYHRLLSQVLDGYGFVIDLDLVKRRTLQPTVIKQNVHAPDYDGVKDELLTEDGFQLATEERHGIFLNP
jgi:hypothetical protein